MKSPLIFFIVFLIITPMKSFSQHTLTVEISGLRNNTGSIIYELFDQKHKSLKRGINAIANAKSVIVIDNLKSGKYGFCYVHDENNNKKLDTKMLGIPKEGYGFSNNANDKFGPPAFEKWVFELKDNTKLSCKITYLNY